MYTKSKQAVRVARESFILSLLLLSQAYAQGSGGVTKANTFFQNLQTVLQGLGVVVLTCAIMWASYQVMWAHKRFMDIQHVFLGGLGIGCAAELAAWIMG